MILFESFYFVTKVLLKIRRLGLLHRQFDLLKTVKDLMNHFLPQSNLFDIFLTIIFFKFKFGQLKIPSLK